LGKGGYLSVAAGIGESSSREWKPAVLPFWKSGRVVGTQRLIHGMRISPMYRIDKVSLSSD